MTPKAATWFAFCVFSGSAAGALSQGAYLVGYACLAVCADCALWLLIGGLS